MATLIGRVYFLLTYSSPIFSDGTRIVTRLSSTLWTVRGLIQVSKEISDNSCSSLTLCNISFHFSLTISMFFQSPLLYVWDFGDKQVSLPEVLHRKKQKHSAKRCFDEYLQYPTITYLSYNKIQF